MKRVSKRSGTSNVRMDTSAASLGSDYFRIRDFEYVQPLYDLGFLLEIDALAKSTEVPKYRTFSLWRAGYSLDGYGTTIDRWLEGSLQDQDLDYLPSRRIRQYLETIRNTGTVPELRAYRSDRYTRCLRLRSVRGLGPNKIASTLDSSFRYSEWLSGSELLLDRDRIDSLYAGKQVGPWQTAHIVPPLLRLLRTVEERHGRELSWSLSGIDDPLIPVVQTIHVSADSPWADLVDGFSDAIKREKQFRREADQGGEVISIKHQMGWRFIVQPASGSPSFKSISVLATQLDPIASKDANVLKSDLHLHTAWSDGSASVNTMATAAVASGLSFFAVTDHSRSSKLQGGLTPLLWLRQANALTLAAPVCPVLHGIEVDILKDGTLDLPHSLLKAADLVVASVHSAWALSARSNTDRLLRAIESGCIDILAHPTSAIIGKPGVPDYLRPPAEIHWDEVILHCARWRVALEMNCFPSRLDLPLSLLEKAVEAGCAISIGSDAHARSHLINRRFGDVAIRRLQSPFVLNALSHGALLEWIHASRSARTVLSRPNFPLVQGELQFDGESSVASQRLTARIQPPQRIPHGSRIVGIDLTAGDKATGVAVLNDTVVTVCSLYSDEDIISYVKEVAPAIVSIDSPLGLPGGGNDINPKAGIVRVAEHDLASVGIPAYPALIDSMRNLTLRGIRLKRIIEEFPHAPLVIESYPGAAQDILSIPRKQKSLDLLREGLRRLGLEGPGLDTRSHDEMDAITSAVVGRYFEVGQFEPMGIASEAQLIVPKISPLVFTESPVICLAGKTGAGKSVVARYLSVFYGFSWIRTRDLIRELLIEDCKAPPADRLSHLSVDTRVITEQDLRNFGAIVLDVYRQAPLRDKLAEHICRQPGPVVVDSIRDIVDVDPALLIGRPIVNWFVDCSDSTIRQRIANKSKSGEKRLTTASKVDHTALTIRRHAHATIPNGGSLEELRWKIDDALFEMIEIHP